MVNVRLVSRWRPLVGGRGAGSGLNLTLAHAGRIVAVGTPWDVAGSGVLGEVFRCPLAVIRHPQLSCPLVLAGAAAPDDGKDGQVSLGGS